MNTRSTFLPFALPDTDQSEIDEIAEAVRSGWVTTGPKTRQFETEFAAAVGAQHAIAVNSCTAAMHLAYATDTFDPWTMPSNGNSGEEKVRYYLKVCSQRIWFRISSAVTWFSRLSRRRIVSPMGS